MLQLPFRRCERTLFIVMCTLLCLINKSTAIDNDEDGHGRGSVQTHTSAHVSVHESPSSYEPPSCPIKPDFSTTETTLRSLIFLAETEKAARLLSRNETFALGAGLQYLEEQRCAVVESDNPRKDPDIVAIQAVALAAKYTRQTTKLANAIVLSFELNCQCSLFSPAEKDKQVNLWKGFLDDPKELRLILAYSGEVESRHSAHASSVSVATAHEGRRLTVAEGNPTRSVVCANCRPGRNCNGNYHWCSA